MAARRSSPPPSAPRRLSRRLGGGRGPQRTGGSGGRDAHRSPAGGSGTGPPRAGPRRGRAGALRPGGGRNRGHHRVARPPAGHPRGSPPPRRRRGAGTVSDCVFIEEVESTATNLGTRRQGRSSFCRVSEGGSTMRALLIGLVLVALSVSSVAIAQQARHLAAKTT